MNLKSFIIVSILFCIGLKGICNANDKKTKTRIAILYFENNSPANKELTPLSKGLCSMMIADMQAHSEYNLVERERIQEILKELDMTRGVKFNPATVAKIGRLVGAEYLIFGSYFEAFKKFRIDARMVKVETGEIFTATGVNGKPEDFDILERKLVENLIKQSNSKLSQKADTEIFKGEQERRASFRGIVKYGKALDEYDNGDKKSAKKILLDIVESNPEFAIAKNMLNEIAEK